MYKTELIYIVDDDESIRESLSFFLGAAGYATRTYEDGLDFIADVETLDPGCLLLDLRMPGMNGFEVIGALASIRARLPVIVMTGHGDIPIAVQAMRVGASDFIEKPFEGGALLEILARVFAGLSSQVQIHDRRVDAASRMTSLTERERDVLYGLGAGRSNKALAYDLGISIRTVEMHRASMMERLGVRSLGEALRISFDGVSHISLQTVSG